MTLTCRDVQRQRGGLSFLVVVQPRFRIIDALVFFEASFLSKPSSYTMALRLASSSLLKKLAPRACGTAAAFSTATIPDLDRMQSVETYEHVLDKFAEIRACAVLRTATSEACPKAMQAAIDGGFEICEFTLTTPDCLHHLADFRQKYDGKVMVGCGTILTIADAEAAIDAGSEFIITPVMLPDVIEWCAARNIVCVPGCQTPTEASILLSGRCLPKRLTV